MTNSLRKLRLIKIVRCTFLLIILLICHTGMTENITLRVWCMGGEAEKLPKMARRFEYENPGVKVRIQALSWGSSYEKLVTAFLGGAPPDVCQIGTTMMRDFHAMGALESLQPLYDNGELSAASFFRESLKTCLYDGRYYGVPWYVDTRVVYYRQEYLDKFSWKEFPKTWEDFIKFGRQVTSAKQAAGDKIGYFCSLQGFSFEMFYWQAGGQFAPLQVGVPAFDEKKMAIAVDYERSMHREGFIGKPHDSGIDYISEFDLGVYEVAVSGPWMAADLKKNQHRLKNAWGMATMPKNQAGTSFIGGSNLVQFKESRHKEIGRRFILFLSRPDIQADWYEISNDLPARREAMQTPQLLNDPVMQVFRTQLDDTRLPPSDKEWSIFWDRFHRRYNAFMESDDDAIAFVKEMNAAMAEIIAERDTTSLPHTGQVYWVALTLFPLLMIAIYIFRGITRQPALPSFNSTPLLRVACFLLPASLTLAEPCLPEPAIICAFTRTKFSGKA